MAHSHAHQPQPHVIILYTTTMASNAPSKDATTVPEGLVRPSLSIRLIRHAESQNNQVYRDARFLFRGGTPEFDESGWNAYVDLHRKADPGLSDVGVQQAQHLADFLVPVKRRILYESFLLP